MLSASTQARATSGSFAFVVIIQSWQLTNLASPGKRRWPSSHQCTASDELAQIVRGEEEPGKTWSALLR